MVDLVGLDPGVKHGEARAGAGRRAVGPKPGGAARAEMKAAGSSAEALGGKDSESHTRRIPRTC